MKTLQVPKENINPMSPSDDYGLRKSIPLRISSILKTSNIIPTHQTLAEVTAQYQTDQKKLKLPIGKTPLIKIDEQKNNISSNFLTKKTRNSVKVAPNFVKEKSLIAKQSQQKQTKIQQSDCNQEEKLDVKLMQLIKMITDDEKEKLHRCNSSITLNVRNGTPLVKNKKTINQGQIPLPLPIEIAETSNNLETDIIRAKRPSFLFKTTETIRFSQPIQLSTRNQLTKSSYFQASSNFRANQPRLSQYQPANQAVSRIQKPQLRLCINCESYVNAGSVIEHEKQCLGFHIILKMSSTELIDFLNEKISDKLNELKQIETQITSFKKSSSQIDTSQMQSLNQKKARTDQVINDLDAIRLKALKRFHTKNLMTKKQ